MMGLTEVIYSPFNFHPNLITAHESWMRDGGGSGVRGIIAIYCVSFLVEELKTFYVKSG